MKEHLLHLFVLFYKTVLSLLPVFNCSVQNEFLLCATLFHDTGQSGHQARKTLLLWIPMRLAQALKVRVTTSAASWRMIRVYLPVCLLKM